MTRATNWFKKAITLGPVQCIACRRFVAYVDGEWHDAIPERQRTWGCSRWKGIHKCIAVRRAAA